MSENGPLPARITRSGEGIDGTVWNILGHTYTFKANCDSAFSFETYDPPGTFVPPHIHPTQDEFIYVLEGTFDLYLDGEWLQARAGDLVCMPMGKPHAYYNRTDTPNRAIFWVSPGRKLKQLFDLLHDLTDPEEVVRRSAACEVDFLPPGSVPGA
ncbi:cupin domain-containing protein [Methylobacterium sp. SyP6R]|uniref:cupin domain-containing protein n=1 Tax=Methylobacterium sp. SyP6R TaxID=2718876 RepID=UPI001F3404A3|nr:cupin domain-containing protein [Methylobacterium sp. SyP6R]MCF4129529.1 cupin domain-containing protein [Methylobacterium sp. SyP6R]